MASLIKRRKRSYSRVFQKCKDISGVAFRVKEGVNRRGQEFDGIDVLGSFWIGNIPDSKIMVSRYDINPLKMLVNTVNFLIMATVRPDLILLYLLLLV